jgi:outer membrane protein OmpA-like peptidoglycan-associated protein
VGRHVRTTVYKPTDLIISEYIEGWNSKALASPASERDPEQRNRVIELYNGSENTIDLADDLYFLEIYTGPGTATTHVAMPPKLVRKTISLQSDVTFEFDKADIRAEANEQLGGLVRALNDADLFSEILITGHTCDLGSEEYNLELSARRAKSVKNFFQEHGLQVGTIRTEGHGEREPRVPNDSEADRRINRRVEVTFVTRAGEEIEAKVSAGEAGEPRRYDYTFTVPSSSGVDAEVNSQAVVHGLVEGEYEKGDMVPRQVIGLHGAIEPGATYLIVFSESDEMLTDAAQMITPQLDFKPNETLLLRRLGGEMALNCRAFGYAHVANYEALPLARLPPPPRAPGGIGSISSPN